MTTRRSKPHWFGAMFVVGVLLAMAGCGNTTGISLPSADSVLTKAAQAPLKDVSFIMVETAASGTGYQGIGLLTTTPQRTEAELVGVSPYPLWHLTDSTGYYIRPVFPSDPWTKVGVQDLLNYSPANTEFLLEPDLLDDSKLQGVTVLSAESINGVPTWHLRGTRPITVELAATLPRSETIREDLWIRQDNAYPAKLVFSFISTTNGVSDLTFTYVFTRWNTGLAIPLPSLSDDSGT